MTDLSFSLDLGDNTDRHEYDPLTGTLSRQAFLKKMAGAAQVAADSASPFSICICDVDQLRNVNDQHGQFAGDAVLLAVANRFRETLSSTAKHPNEHLLARYDGNSFLLLTQKASLDEAAAIAERLRKAVAEMTILDELRVTISAGVSQYRIGETTDTTLARAEQALHLAKQSGRDRVEIVSTPAVTNADDVVVPWERTA